jgi:hypothetical protein
MIPTDPVFDNTRAFFREGYQFIGNHRRALKSDALRTKIIVAPGRLHDGRGRGAAFR